MSLWVVGEDPVVITRSQESLLTVVKLNKSHAPNFSIAVRCHNNIWDSLLVEFHFTDRSVLLSDQDVAVEKIK